MDAIGDLGDPKKDAAALEPLLDKELAELIDGVVGRIMPSLKEAVIDGLDGLTITITASKKPR